MKEKRIRCANGWVIWHWTGWKGTKAIATESRAGETCRICNEPIVEGAVLRGSQGDLSWPHYDCVNPPNTPDRHMGQWLAIKEVEGLPTRYMMVNVDNLVPSEMPGHEYNRGADFAISQGGEWITELTPDVVKEQAKTAGYERLKYLARITP